MLREDNAIDCLGDRLCFYARNVTILEEGRWCSAFRKAIQRDSRVTCGWHVQKQLGAYCRAKVFMESCDEPYLDGFGFDTLRGAECAIECQFGGEMRCGPRRHLKASLKSLFSVSWPDCRDALKGIRSGSYRRWL